MRQKEKSKENQRVTEKADLQGQVLAAPQHLLVAEGELELILGAGTSCSRMMMSRDYGSQQGRPPLGELVVDKAGDLPNLHAMEQCHSAGEHKKVSDLL